MPAAATTTDDPPHRPDLTFWAMNVCIALGIGGFVGAIGCFLNLLSRIAQ